MASKACHQLNIIFALVGFWILPINIDAIKLVLVNEKPGAYGEASAAAFIRTCIRESGLISVCSTDRQNEFKMAVLGFELCEGPKTTLGTVNGNVAVSFVVFELCSHQ